MSFLSKGIDQLDHKQSVCAGRVNLYADGNSNQYIVICSSPAEPIVLSISHDPGWIDAEKRAMRIINGLEWVDDIRPLSQMPPS